MLLPRVLIADDEPLKRRRYSSLVLEPERPLPGIAPLVTTVADRDRAAELLREAWKNGYGFDLLVADLFFPSAEDGKTLITAIADGQLGFRPEDLDVVVVSQQSDAEEHLSFLRAMQLRWSSVGEGVSGFDLELRGRESEWKEHEDHFAGNVWNKIINRLRKRAHRGVLPPATDDSGRGFLTTDNSLRGRIHKLAAYLKKGIPITLVGPPGVAKSQLARDLHNLSGRKGNFAAINLAAFPRELFAGELFGHEKGAYTGAITSQKGKLEDVGEGTVFFDEFDKIDSASQKVLLQVLQEGIFYRLGSQKPCSLKGARIIALNATREEFEARVRRGDVDEAVKSRLFAGEQLTISPLYMRPADVSLLIRHFWKNLGRGAIDEGAVEVLKDHLIAYKKDGRWLYNRVVALDAWVPAGQAASRAMAVAALPAEEAKVAEVELQKDTFRNRVLHAEFSAALAAIDPHLEDPWPVFSAAILERISHFIPPGDPDFVARSWREHQSICRICSETGALAGLGVR